MTKRWQKDLMQQVDAKRRRQGFTQKKVSKIIGCQRVSYNRWLNGKTEPGRESERKLLRYLHCPEKCRDCGADLEGRAEDETGYCPDCLLSDMAEV